MRGAQTQRSDPDANEAEDAVDVAKVGRLPSHVRRDRFLDAAAEIVVEIGVAGVTMDGVAARSGVNKRLAYRFFDNREKLLEALFDREIGALEERTNHLLPADAKFEERAKSSIRAWVELFEEKGSLMRRLLFDQGPLAAYAERQRREQALHWARFAEELGLPAARSETVARILLAGTLGALDARQAGLASVDEVVEIYWQIAIHAIVAVTARSRRF